MGFHFWTSKVSQILFMFCFSEHFFKYWEGFSHYTLETQVIKGHLIQYSELFTLKHSILYYSEYL